MNRLRVIQGGKDTAIYLKPEWEIEDDNHDIYKQIDRVTAGLIGLDSLMKQLSPKTADRLVKYIKNNIK